MKKYGTWALLFLLGLSFIGSLFAQEKEIPQPTFINGAANYGAVTLESLKGTGIVKLQRTQVLQDASILGSLIASQAQIGRLDIQGQANLSHTTIQKETSVLGALQAVHSKFLKEITLSSHKATFTHCELEGIHVQKEDSFKGKQIIELRQGTIVNGPIVFESGKGEVHLFPGSKTFGEIKGAKVIRKS